MIRFKKKNSDRPSILYEPAYHEGRDKLIVQTEILIDLYNSAPEGLYDINGSLKKFNFRGDIFGDDEIRRILRQMQENKCCYCEKRLDERIGEIEHYRPKSAYKENEISASNKPGYYWLAYEWSNLLLACRSCNNIKLEIFPIKYEYNRILHHGLNINKEDALILNPTIHRPRRHLKFIGASIFSKNESQLGYTTIRVLQLDREVLVELRRERIKIINGILDSIELAIIKRVSEDSLEELKGELEYYKSRVATFSAMTSDYLFSK